jgi:hypothetical protein
LAIIPNNHKNENKVYNRFAIQECTICTEEGEHLHKLLVDVRPLLDPTFKEVYVGGIWDNCLTVNYEYLYMMGLNAIRELHHEVTSIKNEMIMVKNSIKNLA